MFLENPTVSIESPIVSIESPIVSIESPIVSIESPIVSHENQIVPLIEIVFQKGMSNVNVLSINMSFCLFLGKLYHDRKKL